MKKSFLHIIFPVLFIAAAAVSCSDRTTLMQLESVAAYIKDAPARALDELDSLHQAGISGREANAKYALLYSMALDKNYIDKTNDSLINIAVGWYRHHGNADEKLKAYYYQGRIYQNAGDNESAMESFVKAEQYADDADDLVAEGMLYKAMAVVYHNIFDIGTAEKYNNKAMACYKEAGDIDKYAGTLICASDLSYCLCNYEEAEIYLDSAMSVMEMITDECRILFHSSSIQLYRLVADRDHFMYTTRMTFAAAHPNVVRYLESKGLSEWQIEYCCLYTIGLKGKDIGNYIKKKRHYIDSSEIREKLGLGEHDTNLGIYLRTLLSEDN